MNVTIKCFAQFRETTGVNEMPFTLKDKSDIDSLIAQLKASDPRWEEAFSRSYLIACNQEIVDASHRLGEDDEVAFFPPVTGG